MHRLFGRDMEYVEDMPCTLNMADILWKVLIGLVLNWNPRSFSSSADD